MSKPLVLTCDIGTQSARALLVDPDGRIVDVVQSKYAEPYFSKEPGWAEQKPNFYFDRLCECCRELCARSNALLPDVIAMTITVIRDTVPAKFVDLNLRAYHAGISTLLAKDGHEVIGFADYGPYRENDKRNAGEVYAIYLLSDYYDRGVGATLMRAALQAMPSYDEVIVWVLVGNERAIRFYEHFGFRFDGKSQVLDLGGKVTELRMVLDGSPKAK